MTVEEIRKLRESYRPDSVKVLFIGEAPPHGGTFFYNADSNLYCHTRQAFKKALGWDYSDKEFLSSFRACGCYLEDLCEEPVNRLTKAERRRKWRDAVPGLSGRIDEARPRVAIIVGKGICSAVTKAIAQSGLVTHSIRQVLPFPTNIHAQAYIDGLVSELTELRKEGILEC